MICVNLRLKFMTEFDKLPFHHISAELLKIDDGTAVVNLYESGYGEK